MDRERRAGRPAIVAEGGLSGARATQTACTAAVTFPAHRCSGNGCRNRSGRALHRRLTGQGKSHDLDPIEAMAYGLGGRAPPAERIASRRGQRVPEGCCGRGSGGARRPTSRASGRRGGLRRRSSPREEAGEGAATGGEAGGAARAAAAIVRNARTLASPEAKEAIASARAGAQDWRRHRRGHRRSGLDAVTREREHGVPARSISSSDWSSWAVAP